MLITSYLVCFIIYLFKTVLIAICCNTVTYVSFLLVLQIEEKLPAKMWSSISRFLGLASADSDEEVDQLSGMSLKNSKAWPLSETTEREVKEFIGKVTSLHSAYGLIDNEIFFNIQSVDGGVMPQVGETVRVTASRKHGLGGWRADRVVNTKKELSWDGTMIDVERSDYYKTTVNVVRGQADQCLHDLIKDKISSELALQNLMEDKEGITVSKFTDFENIELGNSKSIRVEIRYAKNEIIIRL